MSSATRPCQAEDSDGEECDCETFAPKASKPKVCRRCMHSRKHHPETGGDTISSILSKVKAEHQLDSGILSKARRESLDGMRPKSSSKNNKDSKIQPKARAKPPQEPPSVASFKIDGIILLAEGTVGMGREGKLEPVDNSIPSKAGIQILINLGLAAVKDDGITIPVSASHDEIVDILSEELAGPMIYFQRIGETLFTDPATLLTISAPPFVLCTRVRQHLEVVQVVRPTGRDFQIHRLGGAKNTSERYIILSSRVPIPDADRALWRTTAAAAFTMSKRTKHSESVESNEDEPEGTPKAAKPKRKGKKRLSSIAFSDDDESSGEDLPTTAIPKRSKRHVAHRDVEGFSFFDLQQPDPSIGESPSNAVAGPSHFAATYTQPIDLTGPNSRSPSPNFPAFLTAPARLLTPEPQDDEVVDPTFSDPVEYSYSSGPRPIPKFF